MYYLGQFTSRNNGQDLPAFLYILPDGADTSGEFTELSFGTTPVLITWDEAPVHGGIQGSRMEVNLIAESDGEYRELSEAQELHAVLTIDGLAVWTGSLAQRTWDEPFSRSSGYNISLTFSDFGSLGRRFVEDSFKGAQRWTIREILEHAFELIAGMEVEDYRQIFSGTAVAFADMVLPTISGTTFEGLTVVSGGWYDSEGNGRSWKDVLDEIIQSTGVRLMQWDGSLQAFTLDYASALNALTPSATLQARGTDATLSSADYYDEIEVRYDQNEREEVGASRVPDGAVDYLGPWVKVESFNVPGWHEPELNAFLYLGDKRGAGYWGSLVVDGTAQPGLVLNGDAFTYNDPAGRGTPVWGPGRPSLPAAECYCYGKNVRTGYPNSFRFVANLRLSLIAKTAYAAMPGRTIGCTVMLYANDGSSWEYGQCIERLSGENLGTGWWNTVEYQPSRYMIVFNFVVPESYPTGEHIMTAEAKAWLPQPEQPGRLEITAGALSSGTNDWVVLFHEVTVNVSNYIQAQDQIDKPNTARAKGLSHIGGEKLSLRMSYGTPAFPTMFTRSIIDAGTPAATQPPQSFAHRVLELCKANYGTSDTKPVRHVVKGSYHYDHGAGLPFFGPGAAPLSTILRSDRRFVMKGEQWNVRRGVSSLTLEEFSIEPTQYADGQYYQIVAADAVVPAEGGTVEIHGHYPGVYGAGTYLDEIPVTWARYTDGEDEHFIRDRETAVEVTVDANTFGYRRTFLIPVDILNGIGTTYVRVTQSA